MSLGIDFFLHGGIFAAIYVQESPFLLSGIEAFRRIPLGYIGLLVTSGLLVWIIDKTTEKGWRKGLVMGLSLGFVMGGSSALGLYSISTARLQFIGVWFIAQVIEFTIAGAIISQGFLNQSLRRITSAVIIGFILLIVVTIVLQNVGLAPSIMMS